MQGHAILIWESHRSLTTNGANAIALLFDRWMSPPPDPPPNATRLLQAWGQGDQAAFEELIPLVHEELRRLAQRELRRERPGHSLQATALVNEAYLRLIDLNRIEWHDRAHFFAMAARIMRRILVDSARARGNQKRGGGAPKISLEEALQVSKTSGLRFGGARRCAQDTRSDGSSEGSGGGDAVLRWIDGRRECRGAACLR